MTPGFLKEDDLTFERGKPRLWWISLGYRLKNLAVAILGPATSLRLCLNAAWLLRRFAHELNAQLQPSVGESVCSSLLKRWIHPGSRVVDLGCGSGLWTRQAASFANSVVGVDVSSHNLETARRNVSLSKVSFQLGDVTKLSTSDGIYDIAILMHVLEHVQQADELLCQIRNFAKRLIVGVPDLESDHLNEARVRLGCPFWSDADHVREYTREHLCAQLERNGWVVLHVDTVNGTAVAVAE